MSVYVPTDRERECQRLLDDALGAVERLEKIAKLAADFLDKLPPPPPPSTARGHQVSVHKVATETLRVLRGKIEDAEALVRQWGR